MKLCKPTIVVIAYNRDKALKRLLQSIARAEYPDDDIRLVISIDKSDNEKVANIADEFEWKFGEKIVLKRDKNMGLKAHVLSCGDLTAQYGSVIMLEDDLYVSKAFYQYSIKALEFCEADDRIAGISLYNHLLNVHAREPFEAINDGYDNWYFQFASSWGQAFSKDQWDGFKKYMIENGGKDIVADNVPLNVSSWSAKSWLKYYIKYMIENDLYFLYPRVSLTTNFSEEGTHADSASDDLQVAMLSGAKASWNFSTLDESESKYDAFFENVGLKKVIAGIINDVSEGNIAKSDIVVDLYGYKSATSKLNGAKYLLTSAARNNRIVKKYGRHFRPIDANIAENLEGEEFFLYDLSSDGVEPKIDNSKKLLYNYRAFKAKYGIDIILKRLKGLR